MTYITGYGSDTFFIADGTTSLQSIVSSSQSCVIDSIQLDSRSTGSGDVAIVIADGAGTTLWQTEMDPTVGAAVRDGLYCGPFGRKIPNGLQVSAASGIACHVHYRILDY